MPGVILGIQPSLALSVPREGYNNPPISGENLIGLSRARRPHNAIFVNFEEDEVPAQPLEAAVQTWRRVCTNPVDWKVEGELKKVSRPWPGPARPAASACAVGSTPCLDRFPGPWGIPLPGVGPKPA